VVASALRQAGGPLPTVLRDEVKTIAVEHRQKRWDLAFMTHLERLHHVMYLDAVNRRW
jgi:hypothetical protein